MGAPQELIDATSAAEQQYGLRSGTLLCIWQHEDGAYPNPYLNSSGYGGLFGLHQGQDGIDLLDPSTTQAQANAAAGLLATLIGQHSGNVAAAVSAYSGGGYSDCGGGGTVTVNPSVPTPVSLSGGSGPDWSGLAWIGGLAIGGYAAWIFFEEVLGL